MTFKCEVCGSNKFYELSHISTMLGSPSWHIMDGVKHNHDYNKHVRTFKCSNGHKWDIVYHEACPACGFHERF